LYRIALPLSLLLISVPSGDLQAEVPYENALPNILLNQPAGALRSDIAFTESGALNEFGGTDVVFSDSSPGGNIVTVNSITTWSDGSLLDNPLGNEFTSVSLYYRAEGGTWQVLETGAPDTSFAPGSSTLVLDSNSNITHEEAPYRRDVTAYQSTDPGSPDVYYPLWQNTFDSLNLVLSTGVDYQFAVWGTNPNADPTTLYGYWFNQYSNAFLSGAREDNKSGEYLRCNANDLSAPCFVEDPSLDQTWDKGANLNMIIDSFVTATPEPSSFAMPLTAILALASLFKIQTASSRTRAHQP
jgi:hypothetical protein